MLKGLINLFDKKNIKQKYIPRNYKPVEPEDDFSTGRLLFGFADSGIFTHYKNTFQQNGIDFISNSKYCYLKIDGLIFRYSNPFGYALPVCEGKKVFDSMKIDVLTLKHSQKEKSDEASYSLFCSFRSNDMRKERFLADFNSKVIMRKLDKLKHVLIKIEEIENKLYLKPKIVKLK